MSKKLRVLFVLIFLKIRFHYNVDIHFVEVVYKTLLEILINVHYVIL